MSENFLGFSPSPALAELYLEVNSGGFLKRNTCIGSALRVLADTSKDGALAHNARENVIRRSRQNPDGSRSCLVNDCDFTFRLPPIITGAMGERVIYDKEAYQVVVSNPACKEGHGDQILSYLDSRGLLKAIKRYQSTN